MAVGDVLVSEWSELDSWCLWEPVGVCEMLRHQGINKPLVCQSMNIG